MQQTFIAAALTAVLASVPLSVEAQRAQAAVDRAVSAYNRLTTVRAEFVQTLTNPITGTRLTARGEFMRKRPNRIAINFSDPAGDRIVADGRTVWVYLPSAAPDQVVKLSPRNFDATRIDPASQFLIDPRSRFTMTDAGVASVRGRTAREVVLVPRTTGAPFTRARVWIDERDSLIRQFEVTEPSGLVRRVVITRLRLNVPVPNSAFVFTPPAGARIVDGEALQ
jgi:outer membrane lipoprotein carrier protein